MSEPFKALVPIDTGLVAPVALPDLSPADMAKLAGEIARDIRDMDEILADYKLTVDQYNYLKYNPFFKRVLETALIEWNSSLSVHERIKIEAAAYLEQGMPKLGARMMKDSEELKDAVETGKLFAKIAGIGEVGDKGSPGEKFSIHIDLSGDKSIRLTKDITPAPSAEAETVPNKAPKGGVL
jgi:hypothetical protein